LVLARACDGACGTNQLSRSWRGAINLDAVNNAIPM